MKKTMISILSVLLLLTGCSTSLINIPDEYKLDEKSQSVIFGEVIFHPSVYQYPDENFIMSLKGISLLKTLMMG